MFTAGDSPMRYALPTPNTALKLFKEHMKGSPWCTGLPARTPNQRCVCSDVGTGLSGLQTDEEFFPASAGCLKLISPPWFESVRAAVRTGLQRCITDASAAEQREGQRRLLWHSVILILDALALVFVCTPGTYFRSPPPFLSFQSSLAKHRDETSQFSCRNDWTFTFTSTRRTLWSSFFVMSAQTGTSSSWKEEDQDVLPRSWVNPIYKLTLRLNSQNPNFLNMFLWKLFGVINPQWLIPEHRLNWTHFINCLSAVAKAPGWGGLPPRGVPPLLQWGRGLAFPSFWQVLSSLCSFHMVRSSNPAFRLCFSPTGWAVCCWESLHSFPLLKVSG